MTFTVVNVRINGHPWPLGVYSADNETAKVVAACHVAFVFGRRIIQEGVDLAGR